jgi:hypothetical protein
MARESTEFKRLKDRVAGLQAWMRKNAPQCASEQKHLDEGSPERAYWHYGYLVALRDVMQLFTEGSSSQRPCIPDRTSSNSSV